MKNLQKISLMGIVLFSLSGCDSYTTFQGSKYRIGGAHSSNLGSIGLVRTEFNNIYEPQFTPNWNNLELAKIATYSIIKKADFNITGEVPKMLITGNINGNKTEQGLSHIFEIKDKDKLLSYINNSPQLKQRLQGNKNWRIITSTVTIYDHNLSKKIQGKTDVSWTLSGTAEDKAKINMSGSHSVSMNIYDGTIVGYQYSRICWNKDKYAELLIIDRPGVDISACPDGIGLVK